MWNDSYTCVTWLIPVCALRLCSHVYVKWLIHMCDMTHSCMCVATLFTCAHLHVWLDPLWGGGNEWKWKSPSWVTLRKDIPPNDANSYTYIYIHTHAHIYICIYTLIYIYIYVYICIHEYMYICVRVWVSCFQIESRFQRTSHPSMHIYIYMFTRMGFISVLGFFLSHTCFDQTSHPSMSQNVFSSKYISECVLVLFLMQIHTWGLQNFHRGTSHMWMSHGTHLKES